jgi:hypothetical protein
MVRRATGRQAPHLYAERGIDMDPRWRDFAVFLTEVGPRPSRYHSIDRIDNEKGYWPGNVRWATAKEQAQNRRYFKTRQTIVVIAPDGSVWENATAAAQAFDLRRWQVMHWCRFRLDGWRYEDWVYALIERGQDPIKR